MIYEIVIPPHNQKPHLDIEFEMTRIKDGLFTFVTRYGNRRINDIVFLSYDKEKTLLKTMTKTTAKRIKYPNLEFYPKLEIELIQKNYKYHMLIEKEIQSVVYGQSTFNVVLKNGVAL